MKKWFRSFVFMMIALIALTLAIFSRNSKEISASQKVDIFKYYYGDVDDNDKVETRDVTALRRYLAGGWGIQLYKETYIDTSAITPYDTSRFGWGNYTWCIFG